LHLNEKTWNASKKENVCYEKLILFRLEKLIIVTCIAYTIRVLAHYTHISLAKYVFLTNNELKQLGLLSPGE
jgi:hypothetical protein